MNKQIFTTGLLTLSVLLPSQAQSANFTEIYVFGDSLSDTGRVFAALGSTLPPSPPYFNGRFSNGEIWVEYLAQRLNLPINPNTNFAFGGATTGTDNTINSALPALQQEVGVYLDFLSMNGLTADPNALYAIWGGANDYLPTESSFPPFTDPTMTVRNLTLAVTALASAGAKNILVVNLPDLGELPLTSSTSLANGLNDLTEDHNTLLSQRLDSLPLPSDVDLFEVDVNSLFTDILNDPARYNFTNVTERCLTFTPTSIDLCSNPNEFLFWDQTHPTTAAHRLIGNLAAQTLGVPEPSFISGIALLGIWGVAGTLYRQRQKSSK